MTDSLPTQVFVYQDHPIRAIDIEGRRWAVGADICRGLEIINHPDALKRLDDDDKLILRRSEGIGSTDTFWESVDPRVNILTMVSEGGATELIMESRKPEARLFRRFLTHEVWPSIRATGSYGTPVLPSRKELAQMVIDAEERLEAETNARLEAEELTRELQPIAESWLDLAEAKGDYAVNDAAKILNRDPAIRMGERRLFAYMAGLGWIYRSDERNYHWRAYQTQCDNGRLTEKTGQRYWDPKNEEWRVGTPTVRVTPKGLHHLHKLLHGTGEVRPVIEA